jgi:hypothetical protein
MLHLPHRASPTLASRPHRASPPLSESPSPSAHRDDGRGIHRGMPARAVDARCGDDRRPGERAFTPSDAFTPARRSRPPLRGLEPSPPVEKKGASHSFLHLPPRPPSLPPPPVLPLPPRPHVHLLLAAYHVAPLSVLSPNPTPHPLGRRSVVIVVASSSDLRPHGDDNGLSSTGCDSAFCATRASPWPPPPPPTPRVSSSSPSSQVHRLHHRRHAAEGPFLRAPGKGSSHPLARYSSI